jgi:hypothetical protein
MSSAAGLDDLLASLGSGSSTSAATQQKSEPMTSTQASSIDSLLADLGGKFGAPASGPTPKQATPNPSPSPSPFTAAAAPSPGGGATSVSEAEAMLASMGITPSGGSGGPVSAGPGASGLLATPKAVTVPAAAPVAAAPQLLDVNALKKVSVSGAGAPAPGASSQPVFTDRNDEITSALATVSAVVHGMASGELKELGKMMEEGGERTQLPSYLDANAPAMSDQEFADMTNLLDDIPGEDKPNPQTSTTQAAAAAEDDAFDDLDALLEGTNIDADTRAEQDDVFGELDNMAGMDLVDF